MRFPQSALQSIALMALLGSAGCADDPQRGSAASTTLTGEIERYVVDYADGTHRVAYALKRDDGARIELAADALPDMQSGDQVVLLGHYASTAEPLSERDGLRLSSQRFVAYAATPQLIGVARQALAAPPDVTVRAAVVLLNFNGRAAQDYSAATARSELKTVEDYYLDMSYGSWHMLSDVFGPYTVDTPTECNLDTLSALAKSAASAQGVDLGPYDHLGVKIAGIDGMDCPCGVAYVGTPPARGAIHNGGTSLYTCSGPNAYAHEMGHGIGLDHSSTAPCNGVAYRPGLTGCDIVEYGNAFNTMGNGLGHFNTAQKAMLGWFNGCNVQRVSTDAEFDLKAIQVAVDNQPQGLQIDTGDTRNDAPLYFYVEYRNPALTKFNAQEGDGTVREKGPGLHVTVSRDFRDTKGEVRTILIDASKGLKGLPTDGKTTQGDPRMVVGDSFSPNGNVTIQFVSQTSDTAHVKVSFAGGGSGTNACQPSKVPPSPASVPAGAGAMLFQDCDYGGWSINLPEGKYTAAQLVALGAKDNDTSSLILAVGYDALLYADDNFSGTPITRTQSLACFNDIQLNDALSSIEIRANGMAPSADAGVGADASVAPHDASVAVADAGTPFHADAAASDGGRQSLAVNDAATPDDEGDDERDPPKVGGGCSTLPGVHGSAGWWALLFAAMTLRSRRQRSLGCARSKSAS